MRVTVEVVGEGERDVEVDTGATYADLLAGVEVSPHEATVLVDGQPVPEDGDVDVDRVQVLRVVKGG
ncbi:ubiquitin-like small modifier protein SAMP2 [Halorhabdus rudnickae]|uniref:ubiquitin-like small modifier protein SAMP2 n=1 Tax=Halorhabdus rudnickae TaxID=1775544 RepID=UPI0010840E0A|nr:ubiquitin-like small modifier protein 2 [Halorhabdus rudnickae]